MHERRREFADASEASSHVTPDVFQQILFPVAVCRIHCRETKVAALVSKAQRVQHDTRNIAHIFHSGVLLVNTNGRKLGGNMLRAMSM